MRIFDTVHFLPGSLNLRLPPRGLTCEFFHDWDNVRACRRRVFFSGIDDWDNVRACRRRAFFSGIDDQGAVFYLCKRSGPAK